MNVFKLLILPLIIFLAGPNLSGQPELAESTPNNGMITKEENLFIHNFLDQTQQHLITELKSIDEEKWSYKPEDGGWSVAECMDHILKAERGVFQQVRQALAQEARDELSTKHLDAWLIAKVSDRGNKVKTPIPYQAPEMNKEEMIRTFTKFRSEVSTFLERDNHPYRNHFGKSPYGDADAYQLLLVLAAHTMRHHHQIQQIIAEYEKQN